jgi:hypothetical protein
VFRNVQLFRVVMFAFGVAVAAPVAITLFPRPASASAYILIEEFIGPPSCNKAGGNDCPET